MVFWEQISAEVQADDQEPPQCYAAPGTIWKLEEGLALGTAMAISGAAASPNMGFAAGPIIDTAVEQLFAGKQITPQSVSPEFFVKKP